MITNKWEKKTIRVIILMVLNDVSASQNATAYRIGGDEFALLVDTKLREDCDAICELIKSQLSIISKNMNLPYTLSISYGHAYSGENSLSEIPVIMSMADQRMYDDKKKNKQKES